MKKKMIIFLFVFSMFFPTTAYAKDIHTVKLPITSAIFTGKTDITMPMSDVIVWRIKVVKNKTYRRRYNVTKKQWIGDWELVP